MRRKWRSVERFIKSKGGFHTAAMLLVQGKVKEVADFS
jgi:hypothetical protein